MDIINTKWPELEILLKDYSLLSSSYEREQWEIDHGYGNQPIGKIFVIKQVRQVVGFGLREAKELVDLFESKVRILLSENYKTHPDFYNSAEKQLLELAGFSFGKTSSIRAKSRMLRVGQKTVNVEEIKYCQCSHSSKSVEWRVVGGYKIDIAKFCPECGKYFCVGVKNENEIK
jgi:hypothetical protein